MVIQPLWEIFDRAVPRTPAPADTPRIWRWTEIQPRLIRSLTDVSAEQAERRVLLYVTPDLAPDIATTVHLQAGVQILGPGEFAPAHRHSPAALRFVLEGGDAYTAVDGSNCEMARGDLILTPAWCWHAHENTGKAPVIWLDVLDIPLIRGLDTVFFESSPLEGISEKGGAERFRFPWSETRALLEAQPPDRDGARRVRYEDKLSGGPVMPTLDCWAVQLDQPTQWVRSTSSTVYLVVTGSGRSMIGDTEFEWRVNDTFTVPHWTWARHMPKNGHSAMLFAVTNAEVLRRLGQWREERKD